MDITVTIPDTQWEHFQEVAQEAVEKTWNGKYEDFAIYIMTVNLENYIESQQRKQEKKLKRALASLSEKELQEQNVLVVNPHSAPSLPKDKKPEEKPKNVPMTDKEISSRISQLQAIPVKNLTLEQMTELDELLKRRKNKAKKK